MCAFVPFASSKEKKKKVKNKPAVSAIILTAKPVKKEHN